MTTATAQDPRAAAYGAECLVRAAWLDRIARGNAKILAVAADYRTVAHRALAA